MYNTTPREKYSETHHYVNFKFSVVFAAEFINICLQPKPVKESIAVPD